MAQYFTLENKMLNPVKSLFIEAERATEKRFLLNDKVLDEVDGNKLAARIEAAANELYNQGYAVNSIVPVTSVSGNTKSSPFCHTSGVVLIATIKTPHELL